MLKPLNTQAVSDINKRIKTTVQQGKVRYSKVAINRAQNRTLGKRWDNFPKKDEDLSAFFSPVKETNRYNDINKFYTVMSRSPDQWKSKFIYRPKFGTTALTEAIAEAAELAERLVREKTLAYPKYYYMRGNRRINYQPTHELYESILMMVNGRKTIDSGYDIRNSKESPVFDIMNTAPYGSTAEAEALYFAKIGGIIYYAANRVFRKFPSLGVVFYYAKAPIQGPSVKYDIPVLTIGSPELVTGKWAKPGYNVRARRMKRQRNRRLIKRSGVGAT